MHDVWCVCMDNINNPALCLLWLNIMELISKRIRFSMFLFCLFVCLYGGCANLLALKLQTPRITELHVRMDCNGCGNKIRKTLSAIDGKANSNLKTNSFFWLHPLIIQISSSTSLSRAWYDTLTRLQEHFMTSYKLIMEWTCTVQVLAKYT